MKAYVASSVICLLSFASAPAQEFRASIAGHVTDPSGASVPQAKVVATNNATKLASSAVTDNSGSYTIPLLQPGLYRVTFSAAGFKVFARENVSLEIGQVAGMDVKLEVGDATQTVEVTGATEMLDTQTGNRAGLIDAKNVQDLPLNSGWNPFMLGLTASGVTYRGASIWQRPFDNGAIADWVLCRCASIEFEDKGREMTRVLIGMTGGLFGFDPDAGAAPCTLLAGLQAMALAPDPGWPARVLICFPERAFHIRPRRFGRPAKRPLKP